MTKRQLAATTVLLCLALFLRLYQLNHYPPGLSPDAAFNGLDADLIINQRRPAVFLSIPWGKEGLIANWVAISFLIFGRSAWSVKLVPVFYGAAGVLGTLLLGKKLCSFKTGWWAAFFLAGSFWHLYLSRAGIRPVLMSAHLTWALFFLASALQANRFSLAVLAGFVFGLGFYTYGPYRLTLLLPFLLWWYFGWRKWILTGFLLSLVITLLPLLGFLLSQPQLFFDRTLTVVSLPDHLSQFLHQLRISVDLFLPGPTWVQTYGLDHQSLVWWPVSLLAGFGLITGLGRKQTRRLVFFLVVWLLLGVLVSALTNEPPSLTRTEFTLPAFYLLAAFGLGLIAVDRQFVTLGLWLWLITAPLVGWRQLVRASVTPRAEEMFASRLLPVTEMIGRAEFASRVYITQVPVAGGYATHFSDGVIKFLVSPKQVFSLAPPDIGRKGLEKPAWVVTTISRGGRFNELLTVYPNQRPLLRTARGFLGQTEVYLIQD